MPQQPDICNRKMPNRCRLLILERRNGRFTATAGGTRDIQSAIDLFQIVFMQPGFTSAIDVIAVIEHETRAVRMPEIFEIHDFHLISRLPFVQIVDDLVARAKPDEIYIEFVADRTNETYQVL